MNTDKVCSITNPSLALIKYWGKRKRGYNIPASTSIALSIGGLETRTAVSFSTKDHVAINGEVQDIARYAPFFTILRKHLKIEKFFSAESENNFPTSAGLASSSSGFAALAMACTRLAGYDMSPGELSEIARYGSASAARSVFGGFVLFPAGAKRARQIYPPDYWPEIRIIVALIVKGPKDISSREAMKISRDSSPFFQNWVASSRPLVQQAVEALKDKDIEKLGKAMRLSYLRMHAVMLGGNPPVRYWLPDSIKAMRVCDNLRNQGIGAWETMDAGPQVKILCTADDADKIIQALETDIPGIEYLSAFPGKDPGAAAPEEKE